jgi:PAS domain S-box-containing protein
MQQRAESFTSQSGGATTDPVQILLVADRQENLQALEAILEPLHQNLIKATSGPEALKALLKHNVAVVLLDITMPDLDGLQTAALIRKRDKTSQTPIIFFGTSNQSKIPLSQISTAGCVDYIAKPFIPELVRCRVSAFIDMFRQRQILEEQSLLLKRERDFATAILDTVAGFVLVLDSSGRILRVNRAFEEVTGYTSDQVRGHLLYEYLEEKDEAKAFFHEARGHRDCREYWLTNGNARWLVSWCCTSLGKELGEDQIVVTGRDMTELRQRSDELEGFTYSVSHDMRAPIRAIDGFTRILIEEYANVLDDEGRRLLDIVRQNTEKMGQLIDGLLALSRLGREKLIFSEIDMTDLAKTAFEEEKAAGAKNRELTLKLPKLPNAYGDKRLITQVFRNLFGNAIKFTRKQPAPVIETGHLAGEGEDIYFVRDNGVGFDMNHAQKLFGTFQRLHAANEFEGSGIGLATVHRIIERHGGRVWAEAAPNRGATFYFSMPARNERRA